MSGQGYVLTNERGAFVAPPGSNRSYTRDICKARIFPSRQAAEADACGNETPRPVADYLRVTR